jgi:hypothetical protein
MKLKSRLDDGTRMRAVFIWSELIHLAKAPLPTL